MPGIVGIIGRIPRERAERELQRMVGSLRHEEFYVTGTCLEESLGVYVGWIAQKGSFSDGMPVRNERGDVVLVFSGEEFPKPETERYLKELGHELNGPGPAYLPHLYEEDPAFPEGLNGRFHGLLIDRTKGNVLLFNDRYGMHRLYYHESRDAIYFAAEAKAILAVRPELRSIDPQGLGEFVACGSVLENRTLFKDIHLLPGASAWIARNGSVERKNSYFHSSDWENQEILDPESYYRELREVFARNLPRYFTGRQPVAMSLTGGLDTRMIMAWWKPHRGSFPCYTFGGMLRECQDVIVGRKVASACGQPHQVIRVEKEFLSQFPHYASRAVYLTEGCVDVGRAPDLYLNERAREIAPVRMTGNYGGEVFRRVRALAPVKPLPGLYNHDFLSCVHRAEKTAANILRGHPLSFAVFKQGPWHHYGVLALEQTQVCLRTPYLDNDLVRTVFRAPQTSVTSNDVSFRLIADGHSNLLRIPTDRGVSRELNGVSGFASRARLKFLFKAEYAYDVGMPQWLAGMDHIFSSFHFERLFLGRHKIFHFRTWYRDSLARYIQEMLLDPRSLSRSYVERKGVEGVVQSHLKGNRNYTPEIHQLLTMELLHRLFLDPESRNVPSEKCSTIAGSEAPVAARAAS